MTFAPETVAPASLSNSRLRHWHTVSTTSPSVRNVSYVSTRGRIGFSTWNHRLSIACSSLRDLLQAGTTTMLRRLIPD